MNIFNRISWVQAKVIAVSIFFISAIIIWNVFGDHRPEVKATYLDNHYEIAFLAYEPTEFDSVKYKALHPEDQVIPHNLLDEGRKSFFIRGKGKPDPTFFKEVK